MNAIRVLLVAAALTAAFWAKADGFAGDGPSGFDDMTPDEIARELGLPIESEFENWRESDPRRMFTPINTPAVNINVHIGAQRLVIQSPNGTFSDKISSGRPGFGTKRGCHTPYYTNKRHWSKKYEAWMPNAVFYFGGFAIHQGALPGYPASHGCIRTTWNMSEYVYNQVKKYGKENTIICVQ